MNQQEIGQTYRELGTQGADPLELVVTLYDVLLDDFRRAIEALRARDIEKRTAELQHALRVLEQLQSSLDMKCGGEPARNLDRLYSMVRAKIIEAHWKTSEDLLHRQIDLLLPVRDAWQQAHAQQQVNAPPESNIPPSPHPDGIHLALEWRA